MLELLRPDTSTEYSVFTNSQIAYPCMMIRSDCWTTPTGDGGGVGVLLFVALATANEINKNIIEKGVFSKLSKESIRRLSTILFSVGKGSDRWAKLALPFGFSALA